METLIKNPEFLVALISVITGIAKAFRFVHEGEQGIKLRFGKALRDKDGKPRVIDPGFVFLIPFVDTLKRHHVRQETIRFDHQEIMIKGGLIFEVNAIVIFRVKDIYRALFEIEHLEYSIEDLGMGILRDELSSREYSDLNDIEAISKTLLDNIKQKAEEWGVEFIQFKLTSCAPARGTAELINAKAAVRMRLDALKEAFANAKDELTPELAAVLVGIPLVASVQIKQARVNNRPEPPKQDQSFFDRIFASSPEKEGAEDGTK